MAPRFKNMDDHLTIAPKISKDPQEEENEVSAEEFSPEAPKDMEKLTTL